ncbi:hypothetical protein AAHB33_16050 [Paenarthrobacter sp. S56]|uniref:hypothetical protein n=1 Tax=Paenarthrobacter sp. S56 TaxID=3138179 RepID=UPI00321B858B
MNQLRQGPNDSQTPGPEAKAGTANQPGNPTPSGTQAKYEAVAGPFTIRDLTVFGSVLLMFIASLLPMFGGLYNLWNIGSLFFLLLGIILPVVVVALFVARRLQPGTNIRAGSLSTDQFASVTAAFAATLFFLTVAVSFNGSALLGLIGSLGLLAATVLGPHLPVISADFKNRAETPAHVVARQAAVPSRKPAAPKEPKAPKAGKASPGFSIPGLRGSSSAQAGGNSGVVHAADSSASAPSAAGHGPAGTTHQAPAGTTHQAPAGASAVPARDAAVGTAVSSAGAGSPAAGVGSPTAGAGSPAEGAPQAPQATQVGQATQASPVVPQGAATQAAQATQASPVVPQGGAAQTPAQPAASQESRPAQAAGNHTAASQASPVQPGGPAQQPGAPQPAAQQPANERPLAATMATPIVSADSRSVSDSIAATVDPASRPDESQDAPHYEAFWFAVAQPRTAYDERTGAPAFVIEPGGWVLALEDRGHEFLVQDTDGKLGVLRELSNIERG